MKKIILIVLLVLCQFSVAQEAIDTKNSAITDETTISQLSSKVVFEGNIATSEGEVLYNFKLTIYDGVRGEVYVKEWGTGKMIISEKKRTLNSGMLIISFDVQQPANHPENEIFPWNELAIAKISHLNAKERIALDAALITEKDYIVELRGTTPLNMTGNLIEGTLE